MNKQTILRQLIVLKEAKDEATDGKTRGRISLAIKLRCIAIRKIMAKEEANEIQTLINNTNMSLGMHI